MNKCIFLDRDGVLNIERGDYTFLLDDFVVIEGVERAIKLLKAQDYLLVVITNQAGISRGRYTREQMHACHQKLQETCDNNIDHIYYSPYHPTVTESISRKPNALMFEKAIAKYNIDPTQSWMIGDKERDITPAAQLGMQTVLIGSDEASQATHQATSLLEAVESFVL